VNVKYIVTRLIILAIVLCYLLIIYLCIAYTKIKELYGLNMFYLLVS